MWTDYAGMYSVIKSSTDCLYTTILEKERSAAITRNKASVLDLPLRGKCRSMCHIAGADPEPPIRGVLIYRIARKARTKNLGHAPFYETTPT